MSLICIVSIFHYIRISSKIKKKYNLTPEEKVQLQNLMVEFVKKTKNLEIFHYFKSKLKQIYHKFKFKGNLIPGNNRLDKEL